jgi:N-acetylmuramoyl-L-alanine amidase
MEKRVKKTVIVNLIICQLFLSLSISANLPLAVNVRSFDHPDYTRVVLEGNRGFTYNIRSEKNKIEIQLNQQGLTKDNETIVKESKLVEKIVHTISDNKSVFSVVLKTDFQIKRNFVLENPFRVVMDLANQPGQPMANERQTAVAVEKSSPQEEPVIELKKEAVSPPAEEKNEENKTEDAIKMIIETICIDPGHGGNDLGAIGHHSKILEKDITLKIAFKLKSMIESKLGLRVIMTRESDVEVSLNSRVAKANNQKAHLFVSIHVNSSFKKSANGPETYYVSLDATDQEAFELAQKENNALEELEKIVEDSSDLKMILWNMAQTEFIKESSLLADFIQNELNLLMHTSNRGVKQAPFRVLMRAAMPAVLLEAAFLSNPLEEKKLQEDQFLTKIAESIFHGIAKFTYSQKKRFE